MQFKFGSLFLVALIALVVLIGCDIGRDMMMGMMPATDTGMTDAMDMISSTDTEMADMMDMMSSMDTEMADTEAVPVKLVWLVNYPVGGKADYLAWIASCCTDTISARRTQSGSILR